MIQRLKMRAATSPALAALLLAAAPVHPAAQPPPAPPAPRPPAPERPAAPPQARAVRPPGEMISFEAAGETVKAYLTRAAGEGPRPGVVVIHEWWGLNDQIRGVADRFARIGHDAIAPDLYRGKVAIDRGHAHDLSRGLGETRAVGIIEAAIAHLRSLDRGARRPVATVGFCMGGRLSLAAALRGADVQATVMFYGSVETDPEALAAIRAPVLGIFGADDRGIPVDEVRKFEATLKETGKTATIIVYPGVGHAFFNERGPSHHPEMATDAWHRMRDFLTLHLRAAPAGEGGR